ncbi:MAG TPA: GTPase HflX [Flavobacteriales bacterium]|nr:GTPase HflX [Flavobacteriales bacterium]
MGNYYTTSEEEEQTAVLVGLIQKEDTEEKVAEYMEELAFLSETAGLVPQKRFVQKLWKPDPKTFMGSGKIQEIDDYIKEHKIKVVVFDDDLSPSQLRNLEKIFAIKIYDRSLLILDIFQARAQTAQAKTQVELARYQYLLPRLTNMWTHLERQRGGTGTRGGAGEKEIETDRRQIRDKVSLLKKQLKEIDKQMATQRKSRGRLIRVALVGYTNVGKSTIMNMLSKSKVLAENKLFATLDTTVRKVVIENLPFLMSDTVGFIRKLPHQLVESFKSTLDEVREADILLHVVDISHPEFEDHIRVVNETLTDIGARDKKIIMVFNKIDAYTYVKKDEDDLTETTRENWSLEDLKASWTTSMNEDCIYISATKKQNIDELRSLLYERAKAVHITRYPYDKLLY